MQKSYKKTTKMLSYWHLRIGVFMEELFKVSIENTVITKLLS